ncbi:hypothetical protein CASFOL_031383 [Castilleja foliolosa]|uniref:Gnk2-homologous domain-containing protein n=1 Tax=Castilleja foliolosa TaxID=1961234 RepID=A0ABD3C7B7_9LAMI
MGYYYNMNLLILTIILTTYLLLIQIDFSIQDTFGTFDCTKDKIDICSGNYNCTNTRGTYAANSSYEQSLVYLLDDLCFNAANSTTGYQRYASYAQDPTSRAYGRALCSSNASQKDCQTCLTNAAFEINKYCHYKREAITGLKHSDVSCQLKYSDQENSIKL